MKKKEMIKLLLSNGFVLLRQTGSHAIFGHPQRPQKVSLPIHGNPELPIGTYKTIMKVITDAGIVSDDQNP